jgi:hypothetical protein
VALEARRIHPRGHTRLYINSASWPQSMSILHILYSHLRGFIQPYCSLYSTKLVPTVAPPLPENRSWQARPDYRGLFVPGFPLATLEVAF